MTAIIIATDQTFEQEVLHADRPVLVDFWAPWCGPCRAMAPVLDEVAAERTDIKIVKLNVEENPETAKAFGIQALPTLLLVRGGSILAHSLGASSKSNLAAFIDKTLAEPEQGISREEYKQQAEALMRQREKDLVQAARVAGMASCAFKIAGGLTLAFAAVATGFDYFGLIAATFNAVRGVSIFNNKDSLPSLYNNLAGRAFSFISNATTLASGAALFGVAASGGSVLTTIGAVGFGLYMFFNGFSGITRDLRVTLGMEKPAAPPAPAPATEKTEESCKDGACPVPQPKNGPQ